MGGVWTRQLQVDETGEWVVDFCDMSMSNPGYKKKIPFKKQQVHMDVSKNRGTPKWMVYNGKPY